MGRHGVWTLIQVAGLGVMVLAVEAGGELSVALLALGVAVQAVALRVLLRRSMSDASGSTVQLSARLLNAGVAFVAAMVLVGVIADELS